jgi:hypothetical protein
MSRVFTSASDDTLSHLVCTARERLVIVAPGLSKQLATAIAGRIAHDGGPAVFAVIVDIDPEVCRLGYGEIEAIDIVRAALATKGSTLQTQVGVRIGLIVADEEILVYSPTPRLIEAGSTSENTPNAIRITKAAAIDIASACGAGPELEVLVNQELGLDFVDDRKLDAVKKDLEEVPPRPFNLVRLERVFNYRLEFVEFSVEHYKLKTRSVPLPPELLGLAEQNLQDRIRNTFRVFESGSPFKFNIPDPCPPPPIVEQVELIPVKPQPVPDLVVTEEWLSKEADRLRKKYFISLGSAAYGNLILKRLKPEFEAEVERLKKIVKAYAKEVTSSIKAKIAETRGDLIQALFPRVRAAPPSSWLRRSVDGKLSDQALNQRLEEEVDRAFERVEEAFEPNVACVFKGVNYETITADTHFREKIQVHFGKEEAAKLLSEYDASRAQQPPTTPK